MQHMPHFARKGDVQDLTTKDTTVHGHLVTKEDPSYATILKSAKRGSKGKRDKHSESDVTLALDEQKLIKLAYLSNAHSAALI